MNQDFALLATPANARRLLLFEPVINITIPDNIRQLATEDRLDARMFDPLVCPYDPVRLAVAQFLLDSNMRGVIQADYHPELTPLAVLNLTRLAAKPIVIVSERRRLWSTAASALPLPVAVVTSLLALDRFDHHSLVIYDTSYSPSMNVSAGLRNVVREFPAIIIFDDRHNFDRLMHWSLWARLLFPTMPHPQYPHFAGAPIAWQSQPLSAFAIFYNVCIFPALISLPAAITALGDDYTARRLSQQSSLMTLS